MGFSGVEDVVQSLYMVQHSLLGLVDSSPVDLGVTLCVDFTLASVILSGCECEFLALVSA